MSPFSDIFAFYLSYNGNYFLFENARITASSWEQRRIKLKKKRRRKLKNKKIQDIGPSFNQIQTDILADPEKWFAATRDKLALKKSSNNKVFEHIQKQLVSGMEAKDFQTRNADCSKGCLMKQGTSINKLRQKVQVVQNGVVKQDQKCAKNGFEYDLDKEPHWYHILDPVFAKTHKLLNLMSSATKTLFVNKNLLGSSSDEHGSKRVSQNQSGDADLIDIDDEDKQGNDDVHGEVQQAAQSSLQKKKCVLTRNYKMKSTSYGLWVIARGKNALIAAQDKAAGILCK